METYEKLEQCKLQNIKAESFIHAAPKDPCNNTMQLQNTPCTAQVAGRPYMQSDPVKLRETSDTILAALQSSNLQTINPLFLAFNKIITNLIGRHQAKEQKFLAYIVVHAYMCFIFYSVQHSFALNG